MIVNVFKFFVNTFLKNLIHGKTYFSHNIFRRKWTNLGNQMNNGAWQDISAKIGNFAPRGSKNTQ